MHKWNATGTVPTASKSLRAMLQTDQNEILFVYPITCSHEHYFFAILNALDHTPANAHKFSYSSMG
jgi:hypothetical protein